MAVKKPKDIMDETNDSRVYKRARWYKVSAETRRCPLCPPHGGENLARPSRSWKDNTRNKTQFGGTRETIYDDYADRMFNELYGQEEEPADGECTCPICVEDEDDDTAA